VSLHALRLEVALRGDAVEIVASNEWGDWIRQQVVRQRFGIDLITHALLVERFADAFPETISVFDHGSLGAVRV
jgi:hypothetical protein